MDTFIAYSNIDHYLDLLSRSDLPTLRRAAIMKLLVEEEDKLSNSLEQLQFAEDRTAKSRNHVSRLKQIRDGLDNGSAGRETADKMLANFEAIHHLMEQFCERIRQRLNGRGI